MTIQINTDWNFEEALENINIQYPPWGKVGPQLRNRQVEAWGQLVGRTRALAGFDLAVEQNGSLTALGKEYNITVGTLRNIRQFYEGLPDDRGRAKIYAGLILGGWRLLRKIGSGGNADVWQAKGSTPHNVALKILKRAHGKSLKRFLNEIKILEGLGQRPGILPMLDCVALHDIDTTEFVWFALPIATPIEKIIGDDSTSQQIIQGVGNIARTLVELHSEGITHRDLKPHNLYIWQEQWVISDFGIASFPDKEALTSANKKLGPLYYIAPEMLHSADTADGTKADVYSLAKTLWALLTGQKFPPPGEQRKDIETMRVSTSVSLDRAELLDDLLEQATRHEPVKRPTMQKFQEAIAYWLQCRAS